MFEPRQAESIPVEVVVNAKNDSIQVFGVDTKNELQALTCNGQRLMTDSACHITSSEALLNIMGEVELVGKSSQSLDKMLELQQEMIAEMQRQTKHLNSLVELFCDMAKTFSERDAQNLNATRTLLHPYKSPKRVTK